VRSRGPLTKVSAMTNLSQHIANFIGQYWSALVGCLIVPAGMVEDKMSAVWLLTISLSGLGIASPNTWALTQAVSSKGIVGTVSGIQNTGGNIGAILAPLLTGFIAHLTGSFALALGLCGVILVGGIIAYLLLVEDKVEVADEAAVT